MERGLHSLRQGAEDAYDQLHARVPDDLADALREAGVRDWRIWRDALDVVHLVDVEGYRAMLAFLRDLQSLRDDYSGEDDGLLPVWSLSAQLADSTRGGS